MVGYAFEVAVKNAPSVIRRLNSYSSKLCNFLENMKSYICMYKNLRHRIHHGDQRMMDPNAKDTTFTVGRLGTLISNASFFSLLLVTYTNNASIQGCNHKAYILSWSDLSTSEMLAEYIDNDKDLLPLPLLIRL